MKITNKKNKAVSIILVGSALAGTILTKDATPLPFALMVGVPLYFSKKNWIV